MTLEKAHYVDEDTTDAYLDAPEQRYAGGLTGADITAQAGMPGNNVEPLPLPPLSDH